MKTITTQKQTCDLTRQKQTLIYIDGELICYLVPIKNAVKEGCDSRDKYYVQNITNSLNVRPFIFNGRSIKQVIQHFEKSIN